MGSKTALASIFTFAALALGGVAAHASPVAVTFAPGVVVPGAAQFTADTLNLKDYSRVDLTGTTFNETGLLEFNNASLNNNTPFNPAGNLSSYSIYLSFTATGTQSLPNFNGASTGTISALTYTLYEAPGASTFGINASNNPFVNNTGTATALATGSLIQGSTSFSTAPLGAGATVSATFVQQLAGFIVSPANATLTLGAAFNNDPNIVQVLNNGQTFTLNGGGGDLTFTSTPIPTPEPASLALLGAGLAAAGLLGYRRRKLS